jgi:hypothetical protein
MTLTDPLRRERDTEVLAGKLRDLANARFDLVAPQTALTVHTGLTHAVVAVPEPVLTDEGVLPGDVSGPMTRTAVRHLAERFRIPVAYLDRLAGDPELDVQMLADTNVNTIAGLDTRRALYRFVATDDGHVLRAVLSDKYALLDNELALRALLDGLSRHDLGLGDCDVEGDVSLDRLRLRIAVPGIELAVPDLLGDYRMPFSMRPDAPAHAPAGDGETPPVLWAGIEISNSETGGGAFSVAPRAVIAVCRNGLTRPVEFRRAHFGAAMQDGVIDWSDETRRISLDLISSQVADAVGTFCSTTYLEALAAEMRDAKGVAVAPSQAVEVVSKMLELTEAETNNVFDCFARGGDSTLLGVANAVTAAAQLVETSDRQTELEAAFWTVVGAPQAFAGARA